MQEVLSRNEKEFSATTASVEKIDSSSARTLLPRVNIYKLCPIIRIYLNIFVTQVTSISFKLTITDAKVT